MSRAVALATGATAVAATSALLFTLWTKARVLRGIGSKKLAGFRVVRVLKVTDKEVSLLGTFASDPRARDAVVTIRTTGFDPQGLPVLLRTLSLHTILENDIYGTYLGDVSRAVRPFKVNVIHPATESHIRKHTDQAFHVIAETPAIYEQITRPFIDSIPAEKLEWVHNILRHETESERIIFEDPDPRRGFILLPDFKWSDVSNVESVYCLAIVHDASIRSLRDLRGAHIPLLTNVRDAGLAALERALGVRRTSLRVYVHYQPSYYHFHVHFSHVKLLDGTHTGKAVLLDDILTNVALDADYYARATLTHVVGELQHKPLVDRLVAAGHLAMSPP